MKTYRLFPLRLASLLGLTGLIHSAVSAVPIVKEVIAPDLSTEVFGRDNIMLAVRYGPESEGDDLVSINSIGVEDLRLTISQAEDPVSQDYVLEAFDVWQYSDNGQDLVVEYMFIFEDFQLLGARFAGTYTLELLSTEVYSEDTDGANRTYIPGGILTTFTVGLFDPPRITVEGRLWLEKEGTTPSLTDDGHEVDEGIEEWGIIAEVKGEFGEWYGTTYWYQTNALGIFRIPDMRPGEYRIGPQDLIPEFAVQAVGDPDRGGVIDGYVYFTVTPEMDGQTFIRNFSYIRDPDGPNCVHDEFTILSESGELAFDVLANDTGEGLRITDLSDYQTTLDFGGRQSISSRGTSIRTNGSVIYYGQPAFGGWDLFWYRIEDANGKTGINRVWVFSTPFYPIPLDAYPDSKYMAPERFFLDIPVLENDIILSPHALDSVTVESSSTTPAGAMLEVTNNIIRYTPVEGFLGEDTFSYSISSQGSSSSAEVTVTVSDVEGSVPPRVNGLTKSLTSLVGHYPIGQYFIDLIQKHLPEIVTIVQGDAPTPALISIRDSHTSYALVDELAEPFLDGLSQLLAGEGKTPEMTQLMVTTTELFLNALEIEGSPALRADLKRERAAIGGLQQFVGKSFNEVLTEIIEFDPASIAVPIAEATIEPSAVHLKTFNTAGQVFRLWKAPRPDAPDWVEVEQTVQAGESVFHTLTDPDPGDGNVFYRVSAAIEQGAPAK